MSWFFRAVVLDKVVDFLLFIGKVTVVGGMGKSLGSGLGVSKSLGGGLGVSHRCLRNG